jgi:hypothetical protein
MPGGGSSGEVVLPTYAMAQHARWMHNKTPTFEMVGLSGTAATDYTSYTGDLAAQPEYHVHDEMVDAAALNPFVGVQAYDPDSDLSRIENSLDDFADVVEGLAPEDMMALAVASALESVDTDIYSEDDIATAVQAHEARTEEGYQRRVSGVLAPLFAGRATMSTGFDGALSLMANQREAEIQDYSAKLGLIGQEKRISLAVQFTEQFIGLVQLQLTSHQALTSLTKDVAQMRIVGMQDQIATDLGYDEAEARWRPDMFEYGAQMLSAYAGAGPVPRPQSKGERIMGALTTAGTVGLQAGMALKNPQIGFGAAGATFLLSMLTQNWR